MMNRGNMGKEISTAPKSKKVKKMMMGGMARPISGSVPAEMQRGRPGSMGPGSGMAPRPGGPGMGRPGMVMPPRPGGPGMGRPGMPPSMGPGGMPRPPAGGPGMGRPGMPPAGAGMMEAMLNNRAAGMKKGGKVAKKADGGAVMGYAKGGMASRGDGCCMKGKTKGTMK